MNMTHEFVAATQMQLSIVNTHTCMLESANWNSDDYNSTKLTLNNFNSNFRSLASNTTTLTSLISFKTSELW